ncbi:MAG: nucleotidyltransferase domain-containing protein [Candidatus Competibacteraceae bacterium]|nr:nucleotidyltransferase domain-containing protein [Candidatus Competibacteraceae bacterium]
MDKVLLDDLAHNRKEIAAIHRGGLAPDRVAEVQDRITGLDAATQRAIRLFTQRIANRYDLAGAILFGSRARQTHRPDSDADVVILLHGEHQRFLPTKLDMADVAFDVLLETGVNISPLPVWVDEWAHPETFSNPRLLKTIAREGVRL